ncbi:MAG TPA: hypothetical protein VL361_23530 [Candidatus Limnocylindrales bacterium]|nr:hypothetical protein [Candidatus Limnocylindrales bacterium]
MPENIPNVPSGAVPPKKETGKVQPKKETVRINLPPKPSAAPTIKLPTLPPGAAPAPGAVPAPAAAAPAHVAGAPAAPRAAAAPAAGAAAPRPAVAQVPAAASRPAPAVMTEIRSISTMDQILAIAAAVVGLVAAGSTAYVIWMLPN